MNFVQGGNGDTIIFGYSPVNEIIFRNLPQWGLSFKIGVDSLFNNESAGGRVKIINYIGNRDMVISTSPNDGLVSNSAGPDLSFENTNGTWSTTANLTGARLFTDGANSAKYGSSVDAAESGKYIIIGGPEADGLTGAALLYARNGNNWNLVRKISGVSNNPGGPPFQPTGPRYGYNTCINKSGDVTMINGPYDEGGAGGAIIYTGTNWNTPAYKITGVDGYNMGVGADMNADGSVIILGGGNVPVAYDGHTNIFTGNKNLGWKLAQTITGENYEQLGRTCSINDNGDVIALASLNGYVSLYTGNPTNKWSLAQKISGESNPDNGPGNNYQSSTVHNLSLSQDASVIAFSETESFEYNDITKIFIYTGNAQSKWSLDGVRVSDFVDASDGEAVSVNAQGTTVAVYTRDETLEGAPYAPYIGAVNILKKI
jgi:hypothetical protein